MKNGKSKKENFNAIFKMLEIFQLNAFGDSLHMDISKNIFQFINVKLLIKGKNTDSS